MEHMQTKASKKCHSILKITKVRIQKVWTNERAVISSLYTLTMLRQDKIFAQHPRPRIKSCVFIILLDNNFGLIFPMFLLTFTSLLCSLSIGIEKKISMEFVLDSFHTHLFFGICFLLFFPIWLECQYNSIKVKTCTCIFMLLHDWLRKCAEIKWKLYLLDQNWWWNIFKQSIVKFYFFSFVETKSMEMHFFYRNLQYYTYAKFELCNLFKIIIANRDCGYAKDSMEWCELRFRNVYSIWCSAIARGGIAHIYVVRLQCNFCWAQIRSAKPFEKLYEDKEMQRNSTDAPLHTPTHICMYVCMYDMGANYISPIWKPSVKMKCSLFIYICMHLKVIRRLYVAVSTQYTVHIRETQSMCIAWQMFRIPTDKLCVYL